jgi:hypothetical protein
MLRIAAFASFIVLALSIAPRLGNADETGCQFDVAAEFPWVCTDADARQALETVHAKVREIRPGLDPADDDILALEQLTWDRQMAALCEASAPETTQSRAQCIASFTQSRLRVIDGWKKLGKSVVSEETPEASEVCKAALNRGQIAWQWRSRGHDNYTILVPRAFQSPKWAEISGFEGFAIAKASIDFLGDGPSQTVFNLRAAAPGTQFSWYIVAVPEEEAEIERRLLEVRRIDDEALSALAVALRYPAENWSSGTWNQKIFEPAKDRRPMLRSSLYDTSNTDTYRGWYTDSKVATFAGKTYLLTSSVNNSGHSTAIFRPREGGDMKLLCFHDAVPSGLRPIVKSLDASYPCPAGLPEAPIAWKPNGDSGRAAAIDLAEWGGRRWIVEQSVAPRAFSYTWLNVGAVGAAGPPAENAWPAAELIRDEDSDTIRLSLTQAGPYLVSTSWIPLDDSDSRPVVSRYYRIHNSQLSAVCEETMTIVPPPGYASESHAN